MQSQLGYCLLTGSQTDAAIGYLRTGASLNPIYGPVWEHLGVAFQKRGRNRDAVDALGKATRLMPTSRYAFGRSLPSNRSQGGRAKLLLVTHNNWVARWRTPAGKKA